MPRCAADLFLQRRQCDLTNMIHPIVVPRQRRPCPVNQLPPGTYRPLGRDDLMEFDPLMTDQMENDPGYQDDMAFFDCPYPGTPPPIVSPLQYASPRIARMADEMRDNPSAFLGGIVQDARHDACQDRLRAMEFNRRRDVYEPLMLSPLRRGPPNIVNTPSPVGTPISQISPPSIFDGSLPSMGSSICTPEQVYGPQLRPEDYFTPVEYGPETRPFDYLSPTVGYGPETRPLDYFSPPGFEDVVSIASTEATTDSELKRRFGRQSVARIEVVLDEFSPDTIASSAFNSALAIAIRREMDKVLQGFTLSKPETIEEENEEEEEWNEEDEFIDLRSPDDVVDLCDSDVEFVDEWLEPPQATPRTSHPRGGPSMCPRQLRFSPC